MSMSFKTSLAKPGDRVHRNLLSEDEFKRIYNILKSHKSHEYYEVHVNTIKS